MIMRHILTWIILGVADANLWFIASQQLDKAKGSNNILEESTWLTIIGGLLTIIGVIIWYYWVRKDQALEQAKIDHKEDIKSMKADWTRMMELHLDAQKQLARSVANLAEDVKNNAVEMASLRGELRGYQNGKSEGN